MRINQNCIIAGSKVALVPYQKTHVENYHEWMKDPWLQEMTASEPLSIDEEYEMQRSWHADPDKCTFILLDRKHCSVFPPREDDLVTGAL
jgi:hypothetical protein